MADTSRPLFKIGDKDLTCHITVPSFNSYSEKIYDEWEDGNRINRKNYVRNKISGSFTVKFYNMDDYFSFISTINNATESDGSVIADIYVNNLCDVVEDVILDIEYPHELTLPLFGAKDYEGFEVTFEER